MKQIKYLFLALMLMSQVSLASTYLNWGLAFDYPGNSEYSDVQNYALGVHEHLNKTFDYLLEGGGWKDQGHFDGAKGSLYGALAIGLDLKLHEKYASYFIGPSLLSTTDSILGYPFQVYHKLSVGWRDVDDKRIGFFIKHFSDAGLSSVNYGRNFFGLEISF